MNHTSIAILVSGGLDSAILLGDVLRRGTIVYPLFVRSGLYWEKTELAYLKRYLRAVRTENLQPLTILDEPVAELYGAHWSITGRDVPDASTPDEAVFLPGRNVLLLAKAMLWCHLREVPAVALGSLQTNPFPDATPAFFANLQKVVNQAVEGNVAIERPFAGMKKLAVMRLGEGLPLAHSFSCIRPIEELHCGKCNKCAERQQAFREAGMADPTTYV
jgi:7-cyano-7-deazaguanine synthase